MEQYAFFRQYHALKRASSLRSIDGGSSASKRQ
jgi:hypothetical protein